MSDLSGEELKAALECMVTDYRVEIGWSDKWEQAYKQIVKIVEEHFAPHNKTIGKIAEDYGVPYSLVHAIQDRVDKPKVTRGEIEKLLNNIGCWEILYDIEAYTKIVSEWLTNKGVEVEGE